MPEPGRPGGGGPLPRRHGAAPVPPARAVLLGLGLGLGLQLLAAGAAGLAELGRAGRPAEAAEAAAGGAWGAAGGPDAPLNVLHIVVDDLRPELGAYGAPAERAHTPHIDALAARGATFWRAYAQAPLCGPSRNALLSGRRPDASRTWNFANHFREDHTDDWTSLPGLFKAAGRLALGTGKLYHPDLPPQGDGARSWSPEALPYRSPCEARAAFGCVECPSTGPEGACRPTPIGPGPIAACACAVEAVAEDEAILAEAKRLLAVARRDGRPFYLAVGLHKPHLPFQGRPEHFARFPRRVVQPAANGFAPRGMPGIAWNTCDSPSPWAGIAAADAVTARRAYYASVAETDVQVGRLLAALEGAGLGGETAVVLHADHGWSLGEHNSWRKMTLFETATRVPLVVALPPGRLPAGRAGARVEEVVELQDVYPTVAALAGLALPRGEVPPVAGRSLLPLVVGANGARDPVAFSQYPRHVPDPAAPWANNTAVDTERAQFTAMGYSVRSEDFRYNAWRRWDGRALRADWSAAGVLGEELYDHRATGRGGPVDYDRVENVNLLGNGTGPAPPPLDREALEALRALRARLEAQFNPPAATTAV